MKKHIYVINFNGGSGQNKKLYRFGKVKDIALYIGKNKASIRYESGALKDQEDFIILFSCSLLYQLQNRLINGGRNGINGLGQKKTCR